MGASKAASATYHRAGRKRPRLAACDCRSRAEAARAEARWLADDRPPWTPPPGSTTKSGPPFVLPQPTAPYRDLTEIHAEIRAANPDAPVLSDKEYYDAVQRSISRPIFRDS